MKRLNPTAYGGTLLTTRRGRARGRPLSTSSTMHLVLRSSRARGAWSFAKKENAVKIRAILEKFAAKYNVRIHSSANVGNHLHLQIFLRKRAGYKPFIRAVTAAIMMAVSGASRWKKGTGKFWDYRPFTRIVTGARDFFGLRDYIAINQLEGRGVSRERARLEVAWRYREAPS